MAPPMGTPHLSGIEFEDCTIFGPAILFPFNGVSMLDCVWMLPHEASIGAMLWPLDPDERPVVTGVIFMNDCTFTRCEMVDVGLAGRADRLEAIRRELVGGEMSAGPGGGRRFSLDLDHIDQELAAMVTLQETSLMVRGGLMKITDLQRAVEKNHVLHGFAGVSVWATGSDHLAEVMVQIPPMRHARLRRTTHGRLRGSDYVVRKTDGEFHYDIEVEDWSETTLERLVALFDDDEPNPRRPK